MAKPKKARNKLFIEDWKSGSSEKELGQKYHLTIGGVKGLKSRLRAKDPSLYTKKSPQVTSTSTQTSASTSTKRMTFWLFKDMIEKIKAKAAKEGKTSSDIARELFSKYL